MPHQHHNHAAQAPMLPPTSPLFNSAIFSPASSSALSSRPTTRDGSSISVDSLHLPPQSPPPPVPSAGAVPILAREPRKSSFGARKVSLGVSSSSSSAAAATAPTARRRGSSTTSVGSAASSNAVVTDAAAPPALPDYALAAAAKIHSQGQSQGRSPVSPDGGGTGNISYASQAAAPPGFVPLYSRSATASSSASGMAMIAPPTPLTGPSSLWQPSEASAIHQHIADVATKRISTLDYLRKAHEGRVYWFNTYLFDKPDLARMPCFDPRRLARKATNYLLLGLSIPTINDLYSSTPLEFLRSLNALLSEFDSFQQIHHSDSSAASSSASAAVSLTRARLPNMFRRPGGGKSRRSTSAADSPDDYGGSAGGFGNGGGGGGAGNSSNGGGSGNGYAHAGSGGGGSAGGSAPAVMNFAASESDLLPGEEYTYLLTPSLPFEPDFFETFATLCDVLIDCYSRFLALVPTPRECSGPVAELFSKADTRLRKIIVQGVVKEFEDHSRSHVRTEVASIGKVVLGGLM
ncbi:hypothetical protein JDV02_007263 [Purpureocillium takamizusanense]|uniref:Uncharacterized protein n=1 Tax=Purpureocillium takamizusanense TaxID=2060973 RepID=A0A9Q8VDY6_9HYPO|nr:uncharacterized protein JDV02_007263 [Purpureocillium takamizusanense]UNI21257.1 hypothetical protein JDV02_007263 [Purpureocillium takamizusanense]